MRKKGSDPFSPYFRDDMAKQQKSDKKLKVTLLKSPIGFNEKQGRVVQSLGLRRIRHTVELNDTPETRGMIDKVRHLVEVTE
jgi:large subunit ribosomal protein L30